MVSLIFAGKVHFTIRVVAQCRSRLFEMKLGQPLSMLIPSLFHGFADTGVWPLWPLFGIVLFRILLISVWVMFRVWKYLKLLQFPPSKKNLIPRLLNKKCISDEHAMDIL